MALHHAWSPVPGGFVAGIHVYHVLRFKLGAGDVFHHVAFAGVGCFSNYIVNYGPLANLVRTRAPEIVVGMGTHLPQDRSVRGARAHVRTCL